MTPGPRARERPFAHRLARCVVWVVAVVASGSAGPSRGAEPPLGGAPSFSREVRPVLSDKCFKCHGFDENTREGDLRLDVKGGPDGAARVLDAGDSELLRRILTGDPDDQMPPPSAKKPLSEAEKAELVAWVESGAEYEPHWAFGRVERPEVPGVGNGSWPANPVDRFVLARLEAEGLEPSPEADKLALLRRVSLDLTGLPPTVEEAEAFLADVGPGAYARVVDGLLASQHYGERWARRWLDLARYADTNGYEKDRPRSMWPFRDWVIRALNGGMGFDEFTVKQIAGDLLENATQADRVATGFHRNTMINEEGGIDPLEFRFHAMADRVGTTGTAWLGLTVSCAQCHTHKYDPVSHTDYYGLMAYLNNADEPEMEVWDDGLREAHRAAEEKAAEMEAGLPAEWPGGGEPAARAAFEAWLTEAGAGAVDWGVLQPDTATSDVPFLEVQGDGSVLASGDQTKSDTYSLRFDGPLRGVTAVRLEALPDPSLPDGGPGRTDYEGPEGDFFLSELRIDAGRGPVAFSGAVEDYAKLGIGGGASSAALATDGDAQTGWSTSGREGEPHTAVFFLAEPLDAPGGVSVEMLFERHYAAGLGRFRLSVSSDPRAGKGALLPADVEAALARPDGERSGADAGLLWRHFLATAEELEKARGEIAAVRASAPAVPTTLVFRERPQANPRSTHRHHRGEFLQAEEEVGPGLPEVFAGLVEELPQDRLGFARWLVSRDNPLTARVVVNRAWQAFFGRGIVATVEDFGLQGEPPSHPGLLDWLAVEFMEGGWDLKALHRLVVTSATYRQSSAAGAESYASDPSNVLLARGPRVRLDSELVRDAALRVSGLLSTKVGGPSVFPPQPASVTTEGAYGKLEWKVSEGEDRYRRSLYTYAKRTAPFAMGTTFDGPTGEACVAKREVSNTPLQALTMLNDTVILECAQALGREFAARHGDDTAKARALLFRCLTRHPEAREAEAVAAFVAAQRDRIARGEVEAAAVAGEGGGAAGPAECAAWTLAVRAVLNLDEMIVKG